MILTSAATIKKIKYKAGPLATTAQLYVTPKNSVVPLLIWSATDETCFNKSPIRVSAGDTLSCTLDGYNSHLYVYTDLALLTSFESEDTLEPEVERYVSHLDITDTVEIEAVNTFIVGLKNLNIYSKFDRLYLRSPKSLSAALTDFVTLTQSTAVNSVIHDPTGAVGYDGISSYIDTGYSLQTSRVNVSLSEMEIGVYAAAAVDSGVLSAFFGAQNNSLPFLPVRMRFTTADRFVWTPTTGILGVSSDSGVTPPQRAYCRGSIRVNRNCLSAI